jgi:uncharacterized protein DUF4349
MSDSPTRFSFIKRFLIAAVALVAFTMASVIGARIAVESLFKGIASSKSTGLSAFAPWDARPMLQKGVASGSWIAPSAELRTRTSNFDRSVTTLHQLVSVHQGYLEDLRTESRWGFGRALSANVSVPSSDFDGALSDLKSLGRIEAISESGEDSAVKLATAARRLTLAQTNLSRLQKLQRERKGDLRDAVALEKDIAQANEAVVEAEREHTGLVTTVARAVISIALVEDYRAPFQANLAEEYLEVRNSLVEGVGAVFSSIALFVGVLFEFGLPLLFWFALLFFPIRIAWRRFRHAPTVIPATE